MAKKRKTARKRVTHKPARRRRPSSPDATINTLVILVVIVIVLGGLYLYAQNKKQAALWPSLMQKAEMLIAHQPATLTTAAQPMAIAPAPQPTAAIPTPEATQAVEPAPPVLAIAAPETPGSEQPPKSMAGGKLRKPAAHDKAPKLAGFEFPLTSAADIPRVQTAAVMAQ